MCCNWFYLTIYVRSLFTVVYHLIKDVLDEECTEWLRLVQLSVSVRDALLFPNQNTFSVVLKCIKVNAELFSSDAVYKDFNDNLNRSVRTQVCMCTAISA